VATKFAIFLQRGIGRNKIFSIYKLMPNTLTNIQKTAQNIINDPRKSLLKAKKLMSKLLTSYLWVGIILFILGVTWYYRKQVNKKSNNDTTIQTEYAALPLTIGPIPDIDAKFKLNDKQGTGHLRDYYIASSYNSCCAGDFQNDYVSVIPLTEVIQQGVRVLDFALYLVDDDVVVGAGPTASDNIKGTYNSIPVNGDNGILSIINKYAFTAPCPNPSDPLFIHFRIKSKTKPQLFYGKLTKYIKDAFGGRLLSPKYGYEGRPEAPGGGTNLAIEPIKNLKNKIIIICDQETSNFRTTPFEELVNMSTGSPYLQELKNYDVQYTHDPDGLKEFNKKNMSLTTPDLSALNNNVPAQLHMSYGCQMICMNYANLDSNMKYYRDVFNDARTAFVLKPQHLRYKIIKLPNPKPPNPKLSYAPKKISLPMYQGEI